MELLQLRYFCEAAKCENFSKTAAKFGVPPSDISQSIKRLERELGSQLFERRANRVSLCDGGRAFYDKIKAALIEIDEAREELAQAEGRGQVRILAASIRRIVLKTVEKFKMRYPDTEIFLSYEAHEAEAEYDLVVGDSEMELSGFDKTKLFSEQMLLAVNKDHPLASREELTPEDLSGEEFISMGKETSLYRISEKICRTAGFVPNVTIRCDDPSYIRRCVELSFGVAIVPSISWRGLFLGDVVLKSFSELKRDLFLYVNEKKRTLECVRAFGRMLTEECLSESKCKD